MFKEKFIEFWEDYGSVIIFLAIGTIAVGSCIGCDNYQSEKRKERERQENVADSLKKDSTGRADKKEVELKEIFSDSISSKYSAFYKSCLWCDVEFSSEIQKEISRFNNRLLITNFVVNDIYLKDTTCYIRLEKHQILCTIKTTMSFYNKFIEYKDKDNSFLLLDVKSVSKAAFTIDAECEGDEDYMDADVVISPSDYFIIKADLIDIIPSTK